MSVGVMKDYKLNKKNKLLFAISLIVEKRQKKMMSCMSVLNMNVRGMAEACALSQFRFHSYWLQTLTVRPLRGAVGAW
jgi:hypothetical protein